MKSITGIHNLLPTYKLILLPASASPDKAQMYYTGEFKLFFIQFIK